MVAEKNKRILGFASYLTDDELTIDLYEILVGIDARGQNIGRLLIDEISTKFLNIRIDLVSQADHFYEKVNFIEKEISYRK